MANPMYAEPRFAPGRASGHLRRWAGLIIAVIMGSALASDAPTQARPVPMVLTQLPVGSAAELAGTAGLRMLRADYGNGARLVVVAEDGPVRLLSTGLHSACDPDVSFDGQQILFAGRRDAADPWNIFEINSDGSGLRQITRELGNCRSPCYQATLYTIVSAEPWRQLTFVSDAGGHVNEVGQRPATSLYSCKLDGSSVRRLTHNLSADFDPFLMWDGRLLFSSWQRSRLDQGARGRIGLFGIGIDGTDFARFTSDKGLRIKQMACVTDDGLIVFVETDDSRWDGAGRLASHRLRRPLQTYEPLPAGDDGLYHSPSPLADGSLLVSRRPADGSGTHGVFHYDPGSGQRRLLFDDPDFHDIQAVAIQPREMPDGRSSVVTEEDPLGKLYCLNVYLDDLGQENRLPPGTVKRLRVLEGLSKQPFEGVSRDGIPPLAPRRILGEIELPKDGSFHISVPAATPIELQTLDADGMALRTCGWIWAMNHEPRGCIGCHEDGELTPENHLADAVGRSSLSVALPPEQRRFIDFQRDVLPIIQEKCVGCHDASGSSPRLDGPAEADAMFHPAYRSLLAEDDSGSTGFSGRYVHPGSARKSPLIWHIFGRNMCRPWDGELGQRPAKPIPDDAEKPLTAEERRTFVEWIDLGALWSGIPPAGP